MLIFVIVGSDGLDGEDAPPSESNSGFSYSSNSEESFNT